LAHGGPCVRFRAHDLKVAIERVSLFLNFGPRISSFSILLLLVMAHMQEKARRAFLVARQFAPNDARFQRHVRKVRDAFARFLDPSSGGFCVHSFPSPLCGAGTHTQAWYPCARPARVLVVMLTGASFETLISSIRGATWRDRSFPCSIL